MKTDIQFWVFYDTLLNTGFALQKIIVFNSVMELKDIIEAQKANLENFLDPEFGILDKLLEKRVLTRKDISKIKSVSDTYEKNEILMKLVLQKNIEREFLEALRSTNQTHVANFIAANGENGEAFYGNWPLTDREIAILDTNQGVFVDLLDMCDLLNELLSSNVINNRQLDFISSKSTSYEKNEAFLDILRRRSLNDYRKTIECLIVSNQSHIAEVMDEGGVVVKVHSHLEGENIDEEEDHIATSIASQVGYRSLAASSRILELAQLKIIAAKRGHSIVLYIHCKTLEDLTLLHKKQCSKHLGNMLKKFFTQFLLRAKISNVTTETSEEQIQKGVKFFNGFGNQKKEVTSQNVDFSLSAKTIRSLPFELLDNILQKSYLQSTLRQSRSHDQLRDKDVMSKLSSVEFSWFQGIKSPRFKNAICRLTQEYDKLKIERMAFFRSSRTYLEENLRIKELIRLLRSSDCLTDVQATIVSRQKPQRNTKYETGSHRDNASHLLDILRTSEETQYSAFIRCLRQSKQKRIASFMENGGVLLKTDICPKVEYRDALMQSILDLQDRKKLRQNKIRKIFIRLKDYDLQILHSSYDRNALFWIWCQSQTALEKLKNFNESNTLVDVLNDIIVIPLDFNPSKYENYKQKTFNIDQNQLTTTAVVFSIVANFTARLDAKEDREVLGVTKLRNRIYVLLRRPQTSSPPRCVIRVFEDQIPFHLEKRIGIMEIEYPADIVSTETDNSLYVLDSSFEKNSFVWRINEEHRSQEKMEKITKWLEFGKEDFHGAPKTLSVTSDGQLLTAIRRKNHPTFSLLAYGGSQADLRLSIALPKDIVEPWHAVETSRGNFFLLHEIRRKMQEEFGGRPGGRMRPMEDWMWVISELSRDGSTIIRRFLPENEDQELDNPLYLSIDSFDRVFLGEYGNRRVVLFDANLRWNRILIPTKEEGREGKKNTPSPRRLLYDEENRRLVVGGRYLRLREGEYGIGGASVYDLSWK